MQLIPMLAIAAFAVFANPTSDDNGVFAEAIEIPATSPDTAPSYVMVP